MRRTVNWRFLAAATTVLLLLFLIVAVVVNPPPIVAGPDICRESRPYFYRFDLTQGGVVEGPNFFGPPAPEEVEAAKAELLNRVDPCAPAARPDPVLGTGLMWDARGQGGSPEQGLAETQNLIADRNAWLALAAALKQRWASAVKAEVTDMGGNYRTMYQSLAPIPLLYQDQVDRAAFRVLRFTYADGTQDNFKLDCGFQPVREEFPGMAGPSAAGPAPSGGGGGISHRPSGGGGNGGGPTTTTRPRNAKGADPGTPPCPGGCGGRGAGGSPGSGGAGDHGDDGYTPSDPAPPPKVKPAPPPTSKASVPTTTTKPTSSVPPKPGTD